jgi:hypothetical protein
MAPDVSPVGERDEPVPADDRRLDCAFPVDAERVFQIDDVPTVRECLARCSYCEVTNGEIGKDRAGDKRRLAQKAVLDAHAQRAPYGVSVRALWPGR